MFSLLFSGFHSVDVVDSINKMLVRVAWRFFNAASFWFILDIRRRIQLIQDFDMPDISQSICISPDGMFAFAAGR
jgi:hypothetical protein